jgi:IS30 family transposase
LTRQESLRQIARRLGRAPSTVSREIARNRSGSPRAYRAFPAQIQAVARARRGRLRKLAPDTPLRQQVVAMLRADYSPQQIAATLKRTYPDQPEWWVSHETIYQALYVQGKGGLRAELAQAVRCGRARKRQPRMGNQTGRARIHGMVNISQRPAEAADRAVPGHWEGDLVIGKQGKSQIATLAERTSRLVLIVALPHGRSASQVADALASQITGLPEQLRRSLTWDQGIELAEHARFTVATGCAVFFCDPHSPWQRGANENTNGLVRYYFPKGVTDFSTVSQAELDQVAHRLNTRPRKTLGWRTPAEVFDQLCVATTT